SCEHAKEKRIENLNNVFGSDAFLHDKMKCLNPHESKLFYLKEWQGSNLFWLEDHFMHAEAGHEVGLRSILINNPANAHYQTDLFPRVYTWKDIYEIVTAE